MFALSRTEEMMVKVKNMFCQAEIKVRLNFKRLNEFVVETKVNFLISLTKLHLGIDSYSYKLLVAILFYSYSSRILLNPP